MFTFPHIFEIAAARNILADYYLDGSRKQDTPKESYERLSRLYFYSWHTSLLEWHAFISQGILSPGTFESFAMSVRRRLPDHTFLPTPCALQYNIDNKKTLAWTLTKQCVHTSVYTTQCVTYRTKSLHLVVFVFNDKASTPRIYVTQLLYIIIMLALTDSSYH